jgi:hypothetical protein
MSVPLEFYRPAIPDQHQVGITGPILFSLEINPIQGVIPGIYSGYQIKIFSASNLDTRAICEVFLSNPPESTALTNLKAKLEEGIGIDQQRPCSDTPNRSR